MMYRIDRSPKVGDTVLYDNGGRDIGEAGKVDALPKRKKGDARVLVMAAGVERDVRFIADKVWCINGPIGPNQFNTRRSTNSSDQDDE